MTEDSPLMSAPAAGPEAEAPPEGKGQIDTDPNLSMSSLSLKLDDPPRTPTPFLSEDILISVANQLDLPSALSLARVNRICARAAQYRIWRDINLAYPSYDASALSPAKIAADKARLNERVSMIRAQAGDKGTFVRSVTWSSQAVWAEAIRDVLEAVADSVESIEVSVRAREPGDVKRPRHVPPFDAILDAEPQLHRFDKLTSVIMGSDSIRLSGFIPALLDVAPNISTLDIRTDLLPLSRMTGPTPQFTYSTPRLITRPTKLQRLGLYLSEPHQTSFPTTIYGPEVEPRASDSQPIDTVLSLLRNSPHLRQLYLHYNPRLFAEVNAVTGAITGLKSLVDLRWSELDGCQHHGPQRYPAAVTDATDAAVERLILWPWKYFDRYEYCAFNNITSVFVILDRDVWKLDVSPLWAGRCLGDPRDGYQIGLPFLTWLDRHPKVGRIYFDSTHNRTKDLRIFDKCDSLERDESPTIKIRSYRHGGEECFHISILVSQSGLLSQATRTGHVKGPRTWQDYVYFKRAATPVTMVSTGVMQEMRRAEGVTEEEWDKRGVEVGAEAWKVLMHNKEV